MIEFTLADGTIVEFSGLNGTNFIVPDQEEMDTSIFTDANLKSGSVTWEDGTTEEFENVAFVQQQKQKNGDYYICFRPKRKEEIEKEEAEAKRLNMEAAIAAIYENVASGTEIAAESVQAIYTDMVEAGTIEMTEVPDTVKQLINADAEIFEAEKLEVEP